MIRCEHCGSMLPDGAIFCGECGRSVNVSANRRPAPAAPVDDTPPPPLRQPDQHGRRPDPAAEAWLPEATLDPATRAWLIGEDRQRSGATGDARPTAPSAPVVPAVPAAPADDPSWLRPEGVDPGRSDRVGDDRWTHEQHRTDERSGASEPEPEPPLDPDASPSSPTGSSADDEADTERTRLAPAPGDLSGSGTPSPVPEAPSAASEAPPTAPVWAPPVAQQPTAAPSRPSWWVGRGGAAAEPPVEDQVEDPSADERPRAGDTAVVEPLVDRRPAPTPLIAPGNGPATCPVCGHALEPDDIFCAECGAVRPTVTAAFTGPVVPLPLARPDWAADDEIRVDDEPSDPGSADGGAERGSTDHASQADVPEDAGSGTEHRDGAASDAGQHDAGQPDTRQPDTRQPDAGQPDAGRPDAERPDADQAHEDRSDEPAAGPGRHLADDEGAAPGGHRSAHDGGPVPPAPASPTLPSSAQGAGGPDLPPVPRAAPLPPIPGATGPVLPPVGSTTVPSSGDLDPDEDVEETRIVVKTTSDAPFVLHFSTGERTAVHGTGLLGRLPRPQPGERFDDLLTVHDPGKSVSKTHLELGRDGDDLWVSDRHSGNGTVIRHIDGSIRRCEAGRRYRVERGARVDIGEQFFLVQ